MRKDFSDYNFNTGWIDPSVQEQEQKQEEVQYPIIIGVENVLSELKEIEGRIKKELEVNMKSINAEELQKAKKQGVIEQLPEGAEKDEKLKLLTKQFAENVNPYLENHVRLFQKLIDLEARIKAEKKKISLKVFFILNYQEFLTKE